MGAVRVFSGIVILLGVDVGDAGVPKCREMGKDFTEK